MIKIEINKKDDTTKIVANGTSFEIASDLSIELNGLLNNGIRLEILVAALVNAVNGDIKQDEYNKCCEVIIDLLRAIKDK